MFMPAKKKTFGVANIDAVLGNFPKCVEARKALSDLAAAKNSELANVEEAKRQQFIADAQKLIAEEERKLLGPVYAEVRAAIGKVAKDNGFDVVYNMQSVFYGGVDITKDIIDTLNQQ